VPLSKKGSAQFLRSYLNTIKGSRIVPSERRALSVLLDSYLLEKSVYELSYELNNRPGWIRIPVKGILGIMASKNRNLLEKPVSPTSATSKEK
jgi:maltose alpha-D-glucosyltransferase/alpha-amylase